MSLELLGAGVTLGAIGIYVGYRIVTSDRGDDEGGEEPFGLSDYDHDYDCNDDAEDPAYRSSSPQGTGETSVPTMRATEVGEDLDDITGIGETRADDLRAVGFEDGEDIYFADDEELTDVYGIGEYTVEQVRGDIGSAE